MLPFYSYSQNKITNGSFEIYDKIPNIINVSSCLPFCSEITRCLGHWDHYPFQYRWRTYPDECNCQNTEQGCIDRPMEFTYNDGYGILSWYSPTWATGDYFHYYASNWKCKVPDNEFTQEGPDDPIERQFPVGYVIDKPLDENTKAYIGLHFLRRFSNGICLSSSIGRKNEYIQKKLDTPLEPGKTYKVSFYASRAANYGTKHFFPKKSLKAYFTNQPILKDECLEDITPFEIEDSDQNNPNLISVINPTEELFKGGGNGGDFWDKIEGLITVRGNENLYYMTLGNFKNNWIANEDVFHNIGNFNGLVNIYYFIDMVEVVETSINCGFCSEIPGIQQPGYHVSFEEILRKDDEDDCCVNLKILPGSHALTCDADQIIVYKTEWKGSAWEKKYPAEITKYQNSQNPPGDNFELGDEIKVGQLCFSKNQKGSILIIIEYWKEGVKQGECLKAFDLKCRCECPQTANDLLTELKNMTEPEDENCCWEVQVTNNTDCDIALDKINVEVDKTKVSAEDNIEELLFNLDQTEPGRYVWNLKGNILFPSQTPLSIGKICLERGVSGVTCSVNSVIEGSLELCTEFNTVLNCDCCDSYYVSLTITPFAPPNSCCWDIEIDDITNESCLPVRVRIKDNSLVPVIYYDDDYVDPFTFRLCIAATYPPNNKIIYVTFFDDRDNVLCDEINFPISCSSGVPGGGFTEEDSTLVDERIGITKQIFYEAEMNISNISIFPNPTDYSVTLFYETSNQCPIQIEIYNSLGVKVAVLSNNICRKGKNSLKINTEGFNSGIYYLKLSSIDTYRTINLIINK